MRLFIFILAVIAALFIFAATADVGTVDMTVTDDRRFAVECKIGAYDGPCILDTGASTGFIVHPDARKGDGTFPWPITVRGVSGKAIKAKTTELTVIVGEDRAEVWGVLLPGYKGVPLLGLGALKKLGDCVTLDFERQTFEAGECGERKNPQP